MFARHLEATIALLSSRDDVNAVLEAESIDPSIALALPRLIGVAVVAGSGAVAAVAVTVPTTLLARLVAARVIRLRAAALFKILLHVQVL